MDRYSFLNTIHPSTLELQYEKYLQNPDSIEPGWRAFFQGYDFGCEELTGTKNGQAVISTLPDESQSAASGGQITKEFNVINFINDYRKRGHLFTKTNPVRDRRDYNPKITLQNHHLSEAYSSLRLFVQQSFFYNGLNLVTLVSA